MRLSVESGPLKLQVVAGTRVVLMALDIAAEARAGLMGFAFKRGIGDEPQQWLEGLKYFGTLVPDPVLGADYSTREHPIQGFLWSDYRAQPDTDYHFTVSALYGEPGRLQERHSADFRIRTEREDDGRHGIWFNRGAIASHALSAEFQNKRLTPEMLADIEPGGQPRDREVRWLSRGLVEACLHLINSSREGEGLRVCAYEFTHAPVLEALKRALDRGVDVQVIYHLTKVEDGEEDANLKAIEAAKLPERSGAQQILFPRTRTKIPHNKFIVKIEGGQPVQVWTGSTNFTDTGFFGQTNVGHLVTDDAVAASYLSLWQVLSDDPTHAKAVARVVALTPNPPNLIPAGAATIVCSPRVADNMLDWYAQRIVDAASLATMTIPFNVAPAILGGLSHASEALRLVILESPKTAEVRDAERANAGRLAFSNGEILGKTFIRYARGGGKVTPIPNSRLEEWFLEEEFARPINGGHVFFVHAKTLLIDPLSEDPLVFSGSANFSSSSLTANDENMLLIRGDTRVADIYFTEFDRIFRHFFARGAINSLAERGGVDNPLLLDPTDAWVARNFQEGTYKDNRRRMFFFENDARSTWSEQATRDPDAFEDEVERAAERWRRRSRPVEDPDRPN